VSAVTDSGRAQGVDLMVGGLFVRPSCG